MRRVPGDERRRSPRRAGDECPWLKHARLRHGLEVAIVDLAEGGALVEAAARMLPGSSVELHLAAPGWQWFTVAHVLRCHVSAVLVERGVRYRAALRFDRPLSPLGRSTGEGHGGNSVRLEAMAGQRGLPTVGSCYPQLHGDSLAREPTTRISVSPVREGRATLSKRR